jgi:hypothetical protein
LDSVISLTSTLGSGYAAFCCGPSWMTRGLTEGQRSQRRERVERVKRRAGPRLGSSKPRDNSQAWRLTRNGVLLNNYWGFIGDRCNAVWPSGKSGVSPSSSHSYPRFSLRILSANSRNPYCTQRPVMAFCKLHAEHPPNCGFNTLTASVRALIAGSI